jgi:uncharacterized damage-inducible protein DinB
MTRTIALLSLIALNLAAAPLTQGERDRAMSELHASRKMVVDSVSGLSEAQLNWKAKPEQWSVAEVVEHLAIIEDFVIGLYKQVTAGPADPAAKAAQKDEDFLKSIRNRDQKVSAPEPATPKKTFPSLAAALKAFEDRRVRNIAYVETTMDQDLRLKIVPGFKMDAYQIFLLLAAHAQRHVDQISEVKAMPGFPKK